MRRLLIANRGEVALRILRACRDTGIESVIVFSEADRHSLPARMADEAVCIGPAPALRSYLDISRVVATALATGCDAVHPGYGFLAESKRFAQECEGAGLAFVGPRAATIGLLGDKIAARRAAAEIGLPVVPGSFLPQRDPDEALRLADEIGYPILVKAGGGGGGKGLRRADGPDALSRALATGAAEAQAAFGSDEVYLERLVRLARHIEVQVAADVHGNVIHLGERDCSVQRNYQKLVEEAPSPVLGEGTREAMAEAAVTLAAHVDYVGVGTVEFLVEPGAHQFFFIEMNTRLQVEHPVTEMVTGLDLVAMQLAISDGDPLPLEQGDVRVDGHAIEFRVNAEDPSRDFMPSAGRVDAWQPPSGPWVRVDSHVYPGYGVPPYYDSMLAKVVVRGRTRREALGRARRALDEFVATGVETTLDLHRWLLADAEFIGADIHTGWLQERWAERGMA